MNKQDIEQLIQMELEDADVISEGADCNFTVTVVSDAFESVLPAKRQQKILNVFSEYLRTGELHALSVKPFTHAEWQARQSDELTTISPGTS